MAHDPASLDAAFKVLAGFDWGNDAAQLATIDQAVITAHGDDTLRSEIEKRLLAILSADAPQAAKEYACRKLCLVGSAASVPVLATMLGKKEASHLARVALERIESPEAAAALRAGLESLEGDVRIGIIGSLGSRQDSASVPSLQRLLTADPRTAGAAAVALGSIRSPEALAALEACDPLAGEGVGKSVVDARLRCAEHLLAQGKRDKAIAAYDVLLKAVTGKQGCRWIELAAMRGRLSCLDSVAVGS